MKHGWIRLCILPLILLGCSSGKPGPSFSGYSHESPKNQRVSLTREDVMYLHKHNPRLLQKIQRGRIVSIEDVIEMHTVGLSPETMIQVIDSTSSIFSLKTSDVLRLQTEGVPFVVINHMIAT